MGLKAYSGSCRLLASLYSHWNSDHIHLLSLTILCLWTNENPSSVNSTGMYILLKTAQLIAQKTDTPHLKYNL